MLDNFNKLVDEVKNKKEEIEREENPIFTEVCQTPFWRTEDRERVCSSGAKLGGYTANTLETIEKRLDELREEEKNVVLMTGRDTEIEMKRRTEIWEEEQKLLKKIREIRLKERSKHTLPK